MARVFVGRPSYDGRSYAYGESQVFKAGIRANSSLGGIQLQSGSWLTKNFNDCYAAALNARDQGMTHFCLFHDDIVVHSDDWLEKMLDLMEKKEASILSVVIPLKSPAGITSTALDEPMGDLDPHWRVRRLTLKEVYEKYAPTFTAPNLLVNSGLMLVDIRQDWADKLWFEFEDRIIKRDGKFVAVGMSEDWKYSRDARRLGASIWATREVAAEHRGNGVWTNTSAWGIDTDRVA